jgi:hypothetical protein
MPRQQSELRSNQPLRKSDEKPFGNILIFQKIQKAERVSRVAFDFLSLNTILDKQVMVISALAKDC